jgi:hypothetical protein
MPLATKEEGRSDLSVELTLIGVMPGLWLTEIEDIRVLERPTPVNASSIASTTVGDAYVAVRYRKQVIAIGDRCRVIWIMICDGGGLCRSPGCGSCVGRWAGG